MAAQFQSSGYAFDVRIDHDRRLAEGISEDHVRGLSSHTWQGREGIHAVRHLLFKLVRYNRGAPYEIVGFGFEKAGLPNERL